MFTEYAFISTEDLIRFALARDNRTSIEVELAQRLEMASQMLEEQEEPA